MTTRDGLGPALAVGLLLTTRAAFAQAAPANPAFQVATVKPSAPPPGGAAVFASVKKLGLKLEPRKASVEQLVIDHIEKTATEN